MALTAVRVTVTVRFTVTVRVTVRVRVTVTIRVTVTVTVESSGPKFPGPSALLTKADLFNIPRTVDKHGLTALQWAAGGGYSWP